MKKRKLFSITKKDLKIQTFRAGGKGGQHQNTTDSGVRIIHKESGAVGESRNHKSQHRNKKEALKRLCDTQKFSLWIQRRVHELDMNKTFEQEVDEMMSSENLRVEKKENEKWIVE